MERQISSDSAELLGERMTEAEQLQILHSRLYDEAEKIRAWQIATESDLRTKERKLSEAHGTIEIHRRSVLDMQKQNEHLKEKLEKEIDDRTEVIQNVGATRELVNLLKDRGSLMIQKSQEYEVDNAEVKRFHENCKEQLEALRNQFETLNIAATNKEKTLVQRLNDEITSNKNLSSLYATNIATCKGQMDKLKKECAEKSAEISELTGSLECSSKDLHKSQEKSDCLQNTLKELKVLLDDQLNTINELSGKLLRSESSLADLKEEKRCLLEEVRHLNVKIAKIDSEFTDCQKSMENEVKNHKETISLQESEVSQCRGRICELEEKLGDSCQQVSTLKSDIDVLMIDKTELSNNIEGMKASLAMETVAHGVLKTTYDELMTAKCKLDAEAEHAADTLQHLRDEYDTLATDMVQLKQKKLQAEENATNLARELLEKQGEIKILNDDLDRAAATEKDLMNKLEDAKQKISSVQQISEQNTLDFNSEKLNMCRNRDDLVAKFQYAEEQLKFAQAKEDELSRELSDERSEHAVARDTTKSLKAQVEHLSAGLTNVHEECSCLKASIQTLSETLEESKSELTEVTKDRDRLKKEIEAVQDIAANQTQAVVKDKQQLLSDLNKSQAKANHLTEVVDSLRMELNAQVESTKQVSAEVNALKKVLTNVRTNESKIKGDLQTASELKVGAEKQVHQLTVKVDKLQAELSENIAKLSSDAQLHVLEVKQLESKLSAAIEDRDNAHAAMNQQCGTLLVEMEKFKHHAETAQTSKQMAVDMAKNNLASELEAKYQASIDELQVKLESYLTENASLKHSLLKFEGQSTPKALSTGTQAVITTPSTPKSAALAKSPVGSPRLTGSNVRMTPTSSGGSSSLRKVVAREIGREEHRSKSMQRSAHKPCASSRKSKDTEKGKKRKVMFSSQDAVINPSPAFDTQTADNADSNDVEMVAQDHLPVEPSKPRLQKLTVRENNSGDSEEADVQCKHARDAFSNKMTPAKGSRLPRPVSKGDHCKATFKDQSKVLGDSDSDEPMEPVQEKSYKTTPLWGSAATKLKELQHRFEEKISRENSSRRAVNKEPKVFGGRSLQDVNPTKAHVSKPPGKSPFASSDDSQRNKPQTDASKLPPTNRLQRKASAGPPTVIVPSDPKAGKNIQASSRKGKTDKEWFDSDPVFAFED